MVDLNARGGGGRGSPAASGRFRILIVDDEKMVRDGIAESMRAQGYVVRVVGEWQEALLAVEDWEPDLVLLASPFPGTGGGRPSTVLREIKPDIRIVIMAGGAREPALDLLEMAAEAGADAALVKPFALKDLTMTATACLGRKA